MNLLLRLLISSLAVIVTAYLLPGVHISNFLTAIVVALLLSFFNTFLKPVLILVTIPFTIFTFGLFLLVINTFIIYLIDVVVTEFEIVNVWWALGFSILLSIVTGIFEKIERREKSNNLKHFDEN